MLKTHSCGDLRKSDIGKKVTLAGWVDRRRDHGNLIFIDLRDREGVAQVVFNPTINEAAHKMAGDLRSEFVLQITGEVCPRPAGTENSRLPTGEVEIIVNQAAILNTSKTPPFYINEDVEIEEPLRLKYRYLDLRRDHMKNNIILRARIIKFMRDFLDVRGFIEVETPCLIKSSPEGARDFLVPSRLHPGKFYALPQSPQQLKQLLMVGGIEKYYQIARCFRDEDSRADRQPEFTQLDIEMSFVEEKDILKLLEDMYIAMVRTLKPEFKIADSFPRLSYRDAMNRFGSDKPDMRFGMEIRDITDVFTNTQVGIFKKVIESGGKIKAICAPGCATYTRSQLEDINQLARSLGAGGAVTIALGSTGGRIEDMTMEVVKTAISKFVNITEIKAAAGKLEAKTGDLLLVVAGNEELVNLVLGEIRKQLGYRLGLADPNELAFGFIVDFPLFEKEKQTGNWHSCHHPFTAPYEEDLHLLDTAPDKMRSKSYDFICNGSEVSSGSIRIHNAALQRKIFHVLGYNDAEIDERFGHLLEAFEFGAPPHGGIAPGVDRTVMLLAGETNIREVLAFPKNQSAIDMMINAPESVTTKQLDDLSIKVKEGAVDATRP